MEEKSNEYTTKGYTSYSADGIFFDINDSDKSNFESARMYFNILSHNLSENEDQNRKFKKQLVDTIFKFLGWQFFALHIFIALFFWLVFISDRTNLSETSVGQVVDLLKCYIISVITELISVVFFIVKDVFDKSLINLIKSFDTSSKKKKGKKNKKKKDKK